jgi:nucleotide-binding universal stress UspA family protein
MRESRPHRSEHESDVTNARRQRRDHDTTNPSPRTSPTTHADTPDPAGTEPAGTGPSAAAEPLRLPPLLPRRHTPWLLVEVDGSSARHGALVWALREAARREATVLAVTVLDEDLDPPLGTSRPPSAANHAAALQLLEAQVLRAIADTGVHGRVRTAVLERPVFEAVNAAAAGSDLVIVGEWGKTLLRPAVGRPPFRRLSRGA